MTASAADGPKAILTPWIDMWCIGGLSILFLGFLLIFEPSWNSETVAQDFLILTALLNWPHFTATYFLMYGSKETVAEYRSATIWMPLLLGLYCVAAIIASPYTNAPITLLTYVAGAYLAWHYTGQTWGMMATFSYLDGVPFDADEKRVLRLALRFMTAFHVAWFIAYLPISHSTPEVESMMWDVYVVAASSTWIGCLVLGAAGFLRYARRIGRPPTMRVSVPFVSMLVWYGVMAVQPFAIFWVQIAHCVQYLIFPYRVGLNREKARAKRPLVPTMALWALVTVASAALLFEGVPWLIVWIENSFGGSLSLGETGLVGGVAVRGAIGGFINIHHFFADSVIWRIQNPFVRAELFAHLRPPALAPT